MDNFRQFRNIYVGIFLISLSTLMVEIILTKIFSITLWYHFSYFAVSLALFGIGFGGLLVYHLNDKFKLRVKEKLYLLSMLQAISIILGLKAAMSYCMPNALNTQTILLFLLSYLLCSAPFILSSMILSILFLNWPNRSGVIYGSDLLGAAAGCIGCLVAISYLTAPQVILLSSLVSTIAAILFISPQFKPYPFLLLFCTVILILFSNTLFKVIQPKNDYSEDSKIFQKWSPLSRITVYPGFLYAQKDKSAPFGWGMSNTFKSKDNYKTLWIEQDASAGTAAVAFDGDYSKVNFLKYDITALPYYLKNNASVFILGVGGGRDVLTALLFNNKEITGVDIHPVIVDLIKNRYAQFAGNIYQNKAVNIIVSEGRSYLAKSKKEFDLIQIPLIDSWAATVAGAFAMSENSLYTLEAFSTYLNHLASSGILSISRFYFTPDNQAIKVALLARVALEKMGIKNPEQNIVIVKSIQNVMPQTVATVLVKREPFNESELGIIKKIAAKLNFGIVYLPLASGNEPLFEEALTTKDLEEFLTNYYYDIRPNTDNRPFFFQMFYFSKIMDIFNNDKITGQVFNFYGVIVLYFLLIISTVLVFLFYIIPILYAKITKLSISWGIYFILLGLGFMFIEIPFVQQGSVYLGSPTYGLSISLCGLLLFGGIGSLVSARFEQDGLLKLLLISLFSIVIISVCLSFYANLLIQSTFGESWSLKVILFSLILFPTAFCMGIALPAGMRLAQYKFSDNSPWFWALNGSASVLGSIIAMTISMVFGYNITLILGSISYLFAALLISGKIKLFRSYQGMS